MKLSFSLLLPLLVIAQETTLGTGAHFRLTRYSGTGCPEGSSHITISEKGEWITITYSQFRTYLGPDYARAERGKTCHVHLAIIAPSVDHLPQGVQGVQHTLADSVYEGYYYTQLDDGVTALHHSTYYAHDLGPFNVVATATFDGGETWKAPGKSYNETREIPRSSLEYGRCVQPGARMSVFYAHDQITMSSSNPEARGVSVACDTADLLYTRRIRVLWRACTPQATSLRKFGLGPDKR
ncbi:Putative protein of unknown function [Podospora comata]|uniref:DUF4360 domain-containing protein n=1 Tax=Podospora comata TaxID=48703 RepID=A0ABY6S8Y0_PODCO|nr:Putative protein of unknown function [Podospora comata]